MDPDLSGSRVVKTYSGGRKARPYESLVDLFVRNGICPRAYELTPRLRFPALALSDVEESPRPLYPRPQKTGGCSDPLPWNRSIWLYVTLQRCTRGTILGGRLT
jgi:hypothetical protein